jgi:hypothetical protein
MPEPRAVSLRPIVLPAEHGGWGFLFEPIALGLLVAPSRAGGLVALAAVLAFFVRQPLKLALQDLRRGRCYPRTPYCRWIAAGFAGAAAFALAAAVAIDGTAMLIPVVVAAPLALALIASDAMHHGRSLLPEMAGATAMSLVAAVIAVAGGTSNTAAFGLAGIVAGRSLPAILYVRTLLGRTQRGAAVAAHVLAIVAAAWYAPPFAVAAMVALLVRAVWGLAHEPPPAKTIGWREIAFGAMTIVLVAIGY